MKTRVFVSYAPEDREFCTALLKHLAALRNSGLIESWHDGEIQPGADWRAEIDAQLDSAHIVVLLVSASLLDFEYCSGVKFAQVLQLWNATQVRVVPVLVRACDWQATPLAHLQFLPSGAKPVANWQQPDDAWVEVVRTVRNWVTPSLSDEKSSTQQALLASQPGSDEIEIPVLQDPPDSPDNPTEHARATSTSIRIRDLVDQLERALLARERHIVDDREKAALLQRIDQLVAQIMAHGRVQQGDVVAGTELIKPLASGNFGTIWLSKSLETSELKATKVFHLEKLAEGRMLWHFRRGAVAMERLRRDKLQRNIVAIHSIDETSLAFSMDFLNEGSLENIAERGWALKKKIAAMLTICRAVAAAHHIGIIHRDIKPGNVLLNRQHEPVLTDFDIADIRFLTRLSQTAGGLGTPVFAAPEQLEDERKADERSDVYSLGRLLYFLLLERSPGVQIERDPSLENISHFPPALVAIVRRATNFSPTKRYQGVLDVVEALESYQTRGAALRAAWNRASRWIRMNAALLTTACIVAGAAVSLAVVQTKRAEAEATARAEAERLQSELASATDKLSKASQEYADLEKQKGTIRESISQSVAELDTLQASLAQLPPGSTERKSIEARIVEQTKKLDGLRQKQSEIDLRAKSVQEELTVTLRRVRQVRGVEVAPSILDDPGLRSAGYGPEGCTMNINCIPIVNVVLDGRPLGTTPKVGVSVSCGSHTVTFIHPEKGKKSVTVTATPGRTATAATKF